MFIEQETRMVRSMKSVWAVFTASQTLRIFIFIVITTAQLLGKLVDLISINPYTWESLEFLEDSYRISAYIPLLKHIIQLLSWWAAVLKLPVLLPEVICKARSFRCVWDPYIQKVFLNDNEGLHLMKLKGEMYNWQHQWKNKSENSQKIPTKTLYIYQAFDRYIYHLIHSLLHIFCTRPVPDRSLCPYYDVEQAYPTYIVTLN